MTALLLASLAAVQATELQLSSLFSDGAVLQQQTRSAVWGWAPPGTTVEVSGNWSEGARATARAGASGYWLAKVPTGKAGGPFRLTVSQAGKTLQREVYLGEVWICSGQSNMQWTLAQCDGGRPGGNMAEVQGNNPMLRRYFVPLRHSNVPVADVDRPWEAAGGAGMGDWSAVAYWFGRKLQEELDVPVGLITTSYGGTEVERWTSPSAVMSKLSPNGQMPLDGNGNWRGSTLYNAMIQPVLPFSARGFLWYQGESNVGRAEQYAMSFPLMIEDWRRWWKNDEMSFYFVQIAPHTYDGSAKSAELRESQRLALSVPKTGMVVTTDLVDNLADIHPRDKFNVGHRLAAWALAKDYGLSTAFSGPLYQKVEAMPDSVRVHFANAQGLKAGPKGLNGFQIAETGGEFVNATARIVGETVVLTAEGMRNPTEVRYGWSATPEASLFNGAGLPASPFRSDQRPLLTAGVRW